MIRRGLAGIVVLALACSPFTGVGGGPRPAPGAQLGAPSGSAADTATWIARVIGTLSVRDRVAQTVMMWTLGDYTSVDDSSFAEVLRWVEHDHIGGITMSLGTPIEVASKLNYLQERAPIPLLVSSDLEPGLMRLESAVFPHYLLETGGATAFPPSMAIAATARDSDAYDVARATAEEARAVGIQLNFAPVVDVNINPDNPVIGTRSFGEDATRVARLSALFVHGTHDGGALATAKHFPGHGDTDVDSHVGLPVVTATPDRLSHVELVPFRAAIDAGVDLVMSAHIALPAVGGDSTTPATLRPDVMTSLLRDSLGFRGVAITDALTMEGVGKGYPVEQAVVLALRAGSDVLLRPTDVTRSIDAVVAALGDGRLTQGRIDSAVTRILWRKARLGLFSNRLVSLDSLRNVVGSRAHRALAQDIAERAITLVRDSAGSVPLRSGASIAVVTYMPETELKAGRAFMAELTRLHPGTRLAGKLQPNSAASQLDSIARAAGTADAIVIGVFVRRIEGQGRTTIPPTVAHWIDSVAASPRVAVVSFGNPYIIRQFPSSRAYLNTYGITDVLEIAAARALTGARPIRGRSPVSLPGFFTLGDGITR
jgi:beta-N-acetylhexosaminidase